MVLVKKWSFKRKKVVQLFKDQKSKNRVGRPGSIPEWNSKILLVAVNWFNSLIGAETTTVQGRPVTSQSVRKYTKRKGRPGGGAY